MGHQGNSPPSAASNVFAWALNVSTSVLIVFANKVLLDRRTGYGYCYATTLCALHFLSCAVSIWAAQALGFAKRASIPWADVLVFAVVASVSIGSLNLSLLVNSVGFYQIAKLLIIPCVCAIEVAVMGRRLSAQVAASIVTVVVGVGVVTVNELGDVHFNLLGLLIAALSVVSSGAQQIMCGSLQRKHGLSSHQLLSNTAHIQGLMLLVVGPLIDLALSGEWVLRFQWTGGAARAMAVSCALAVLVNISQFMCLGRFSAVTFQVLGHTKTVLVLLASWLVFHEPMTPRKLLGMTLAVAGMVAYSLLTIRPAAAPSTSKAPGSPKAPAARQEAEVEVTADGRGGRLRARRA